MTSDPGFYNERMGWFKVSRLRLIWDWLPAALSMLMIALESTATMSAENTSQFLYPLWVRLFGAITPAHWAEIHHLIRKSGHFLGYGVVSLTFFYSWRQTFKRMAVKSWAPRRRASLLAVLCTLIVACLDEYHQSFLPTRTSSPLDVCIDLCGAVTAQLLLLVALQLIVVHPRTRFT